MFAKQVLQEELTYHNRWLASQELKAAKQGNLNIFDYRPNGRSDYYYEEIQQKDLIVLHHTAGWFWGDLDTLTQSHYHVSVSFVIARSGWIYRLFNPAIWSSHLGTERNVVGGSVFNGKRSIAIEISNVGQLTQNDTEMRFVHSKYCDVTETEFYTKLATPFRGERVFASFTRAQYTALNQLLNELCSKFGISRTFLPLNKRFKVFADDDVARAYKGIASHVNFRATGKTDIGPAFDWAAIGG